MATDFNSYAYDKAKYHLDGDFPSDLDEDNASTHTAFFLNWIVEKNLASEELVSSSKKTIAQIFARETNPIQLYADWDYCLIGDMLSDEGNKFAIKYFDFERGSYLQDYEACFPGLPSLFHVEPTWDNFDKIKSVMDRRFKEWRQNTR
ncbi:MAG: hypothetical protein AAFY83_05735 [Pseudomonadota bacterium]